MAQDMSQGTPGSSVGASPVDDATYNLLQALTSKLEALDAYERYQEDDDTGIFGRLLEDDREHARMLLETLRTRLAGG